MIPAGAVTGGPEALHQLSDSLIAQGVDARAWYVSKEGWRQLDEMAKARKSLFGQRIAFGEQAPTPQPYLKYRVQPCTEPVSIDESTVWVLPEIFLHWADLFGKARVVAWWLSVDNAFASLAKTNLNVLRRPHVSHVAQSIYAMRVAQALGFDNCRLLGDYTPEAPPIALTSSSGKRSGRVVINGHKVKVWADLKALKAQIETAHGLEVTIIEGLSRQAVYEQLESSTVYLDLGCFPGKDRMPREAMVRGCVPLLLKAGAAACADFDLPAECLLDDDTDLSAAAQRCADLTTHHAAVMERLRMASLAVACEAMTFHAQVGALVKRIG